MTHVYMAYGTGFLATVAGVVWPAAWVGEGRGFSIGLRANQATSMEIKSPIGIILDAAESLLLHLLLPTAYLLSYSADFIFT